MQAFTWCNIQKCPTKADDNNIISYQVVIIPTYFSYQLINDCIVPCASYGHARVPGHPSDRRPSLPAVIESLTLETNSSVATSTAPAVPVFRFTLGEPAWLSCRSVGGNPRPTLTVSRGAEDITHMFAQRARNTTSGPRGLQVGGCACVRVRASI